MMNLPTNKYVFVEHKERCLQSTHQSAEDHKNASDIGPSFSNLKSTGEKWDPSDKKRTL